MKLEREFNIDRPRKEIVSSLQNDQTFAALFPDTRVTPLGSGVRETATPFLGGSREIRFIFETLPDGNVRFEKICDGNVWRSLHGEVRLEEGGPSTTHVRLQMDGQTRSLVPEFTIRGPMREQIDQMAQALMKRFEQR